MTQEGNNFRAIHEYTDFQPIQALISNEFDSLDHFYPQKVFQLFSTQR